MKPAGKWVVPIVAAVLLVSTAAAAWAAPQDQQQQQAKPNYTLAEYNAYQAAHNGKRSTDEAEGS